MRMTIIQLKIGNMRSTSHQEEEFAGCNAKVRAETEGGKTTMADAWSWLWNSRDSSGKTGRGMRPVYRSGPKKDQPVRGLTSVVEATLLIAEADDPAMNGTFVLRKEEAEKATECERKGRVEIEYSYPKEHRINGDHVKEKDFKAWISQIADPDIIRALTDQNYFLADEKKGGMHHAERRKLLRAMGGDIGTPEGLEDVTKAIKGRTLVGYKKELQEQRVKYEKELDAAPGLVGENQRMMGEYKQSDSVDELDAKREIEIETLVGIAEERVVLLKAETVREDARQKLNNLCAEQANREAFLANDTSGTEKLQKEAAGLRAAVTMLRNELEGHADVVSELSSKRARIKDAVEQAMQMRAGIQEEYSTAKDKPTTNTCYACSQQLPQEQLEQIEQKRQGNLAAITERGNKVQAEIKAKQAELDKLQEQFQEAEQERLTAQAKLLEAQTARDKRCTEIDAAIKACPRTKPIDDDEWVRIKDDIVRTEGLIGEPVSDQLTKLENRKQTGEAEKERLDKALKDADKAKECITRIAELEARQKELAQMIATASGKLHRVQLYQRAESELISDAVNGRFKGVEFRLFKECLNGEIEPCCDALDNGVPYTEMSGGQKIRASVGAIEALSTYYKLWMPLFIDNRQDLTGPLDLETQTIELYAVEGVKELQVELWSAARKGAA